MRSCTSLRASSTALTRTSSSNIPWRAQSETLFELRSLMRDDAFREALRECTADDDALQDYVLAIETFEDTIPAARDIASLLGVPETEIYNSRRKLARRLGKHGFAASRRRSKV